MKEIENNIIYVYINSCPQKHCNTLYNIITAMAAVDLREIRMRIPSTRIKKKKSLVRVGAYAGTTPCAADRQR